MDLRAPEAPAKGGLFSGLLATWRRAFPAAPAAPDAPDAPARARTLAPVGSLPGEAAASPLSRIFYLYVDPLFAKGNANDGILSERDLLPLTPGDAPAVVSAEFERLLAKHTELGAANPVTSALWEQFRAPMITAGWRALAALAWTPFFFSAAAPLTLSRFFFFAPLLFLHSQSSCSTRR